MLIGGHLETHSVDRKALKKTLGSGLIFYHCLLAQEQAVEVFEGLFFADRMVIILPIELQCWDVEEERFDLVVFKYLPRPFLSVQPL